MAEDSAKQAKTTQQSESKSPKTKRNAFILPALVAVVVLALGIVAARWLYSCRSGLPSPLCRDLLPSTVQTSLQAHSAAAAEETPTPRPPTASPSATPTQQPSATGTATATPPPPTPTPEPSPTADPSPTNDHPVTTPATEETPSPSPSPSPSATATKTRTPTPSPTPTATNTATPPPAAASGRPDASLGAISSPGSPVILRAAPNTAAAHVEALEVGTVVTLIEQTSLSHWYRVRTSSGLVGWVAAPFLKRNGPPPPIVTPEPGPITPIDTGRHVLGELPPGSKQVFNFSGSRDLETLILLFRPDINTSDRTYIKFDVFTDGRDIGDGSPYDQIPEVVHIGALVWRGMQPNIDYFIDIRNEGRESIEYCLVFTDTEISDWICRYY